MKAAGRGWATAGFILGIGGSVSGNVAHVFVVNPRPPAGAVIGAAMWPVALLVSLEVIARVQWPSGRIYWFTRYAGLTTVACIAALLSYKHLSALLTAYGEDPLSAALGPLVLDGLLVVCSTALLAIADNLKQPTRRRRPAIGTLEDAA
jgi:hypothetical protein